jgi:prepilin-type N-terminal cleavage/methylation domain-containing protein
LKMNIFKKKFNGFTLIEMMLVLVIASSIIVMALNLSQVKIAQLRRERTAIQMEAVLNAAASYYVSAGVWPTISTLQTAGFLPAGTIYTGWGDTITGASNAAGGFTVSAVLSHQSATENQNNALIVAGMLPLGAVTGSPATTVTGQINVPGQNLNNALSVNFGAVYYSGACVPAPTCPAGMTATIMVVPVAAAGVTGNPTCTNDQNPANCTTVPAAPLTAFTAFYRGQTTTNNSPQTATPGPADCEVEPSTGPANNAVPCNFGSNSNPSATQTYWRVCLAVSTTSGMSYPSSSDSNNYSEGKLTGTILAITRCQPQNGDVPAGSDSTVWTPNSGWHQ